MLGGGGVNIVKPNGMNHVLEECHDSPFTIVSFREDEGARPIEHLFAGQTMSPKTSNGGSHLIIHFILLPR